MKVEMNTLHKLKEGVDILANAVAVTMGPKGRNVVIRKPGVDLQVTKDGVTVAKAIDELDDDLNDIGANMVKEVAERAGTLSGDGTTTATVLAQEIIRLAVQNIAAGSNPIDIKRDMDKALTEVVESLRSQSKDIELGSKELANVASISANNDEELGNLLAELFNTVGKSGVVSIEASANHETYVETVSGMQFDRGFISPLFATTPDGTQCELVKPMYLINNGKLNDHGPIMMVLELARKVGRPLVVIADDVDGQALNQLLVNTIHRTQQSVAIKSPGFSESRYDLLTDLAIVTRSMVFGEGSEYTLDMLDKDNIEEEMFGGSEAISVDRGNTVIVDGYGEAKVIENRSATLEKQVESAESAHEKKQLNSRIAKLTGGVGVLYIGANTPVEAKEKRDRADDALCAVQAAIQEGVVPGGGLALLNAKAAVTTGSIGANIIMKACEKPMKTIAENSGTNGDVIVAEVNRSEEGIGYNAKTGEYEYLYGEGVIDPTKVTRVALESAVSAAGMVILTECAIY